MSALPKILMVDDKIENLIALERVLAGLGAEFVRAASGNQALKMTLDNDFAIALIDVQMPGMDGFETVELMRQSTTTRHLPVIFVSAIYKEDFYQIRGIQAGAVDFITKPVIPEILIGKVRVFLELYENRRLMEQEIQRRKSSEAALTASEAELMRKNELLSQHLEQLAASEARFATLVLTIPDIVYRIDKDGFFTFLNEAVRRIGYEPEELIGRHFNEILLPSQKDLVGRDVLLPGYAGKVTGDADAPKLFDERRTGTRKTTGLELRLAVKGKKESMPGYLVPITDDAVVVEINSSGLWEVKPGGQGKRFIGTVGVIRDISERKRFETALRESENRLRTILDHTQAAILVVDAETRRIVEANPAAMRMIGLPGERIVGEVCHQFVCPNDRDQCPVLDLGQNVDNSERVLLRGDGSRIPILKTAATIDLNGRSHLLESFVDISELKQAEEKLEHANANLEAKVEARTAELKRSQAKLIQTEKVAALGTLTAGIAHELNNPMMGMLNFIQYCLKHTGREHRTHEILEDAERETRRCIKIVQNLLTFSRVESSESEPFEIADLEILTDRVCRLLSYRIEKEGVSLYRHMDDNVPKIPLKVGNFQQVILNLLGNALDAVKESETKQIDITVSNRGKILQIMVADTGSGIPPDKQDYVLDPFFTTKPVGKGTGLGLSVSQGIIHDHGGTLTFDSDPGKGTTFVVELPLKREQRAEIGEQRAERSDKSVGNEK